MQFLATLTLLVATALANPIVCRTSKEFKLKTTGATIEDLNNLYLYSYHTGAGLSDAVFDSNGTNAPSFYLNGTLAYADLGTSLAYGLTIEGDTNYADWEPVLIDVGEGSSGFSINKDGDFVGSSASEFGGWLVCPWYHNAPQLFALISAYTADIPSSCSKVTLKAIY